MTAPPVRLAAALADRYRLERELGQGGMATVFLAHDLKHDRRVAIKVLRPDLAAVIGADRFLREIRTIATLQHPHILGLIDSGEVDGTAYYVMPYVEGESLRDRLRREKQLPVAEAVRIATEVAAALDYAHRHGVIHRDIKPENVLLHDGAALVADFGIALAVSSAGGASRMTETGMSLGTPHYMSPEQAMGEREITARSDVYALGAMAYEMLVGDPPFTGSTAQAIVAKVVTEKPRAIHPQRDTVPPAVEYAVLTALQKLPADRFATAADFAAALHEAPGARTRVVPRYDAGKRGWRERLRDPVVLLLAAVALAAVAAGVVRGRPATGAPAGVVRFIIPVPATGNANALGYSTLAVSPDGRMLVYVGQEESRRQQLMVRPIDDVTARPLPGTEDASNPFFSPDGRWIAFVRRNQLFKIAVDGSAPQRLATLPGAFSGASWSATGKIILSGNTGLWVVPEAGGAAQRLGGPSRDDRAGQLYQNAPLALDDLGLVLFSSWRSTFLPDARIAIASLETGERTVLDLPGVQPLGLVNGALVYVTAAGVIMGAPVDLAQRRLLGAPVQLGDQVMVNAGTGLARASLSRTGTLVYQTGTGLSRLVLVGANGGSRPLRDEPADYAFPRLSPDARTLALTIGAAEHRDVWLGDLTSGTLTRFTTEGNNERPEWTPDGKRVLYRSDRWTRSAIWWRPADLSAEPALLLSGEHVDIFEAVLSPDGRTIAYQLDTLAADIYARSLDGDTMPRPVAVGAAIEQMPRISPDGRWIAYGSDESGREEVVVQPFPGPGGRIQVSTGGGTEPVWARDGRRLFYRGDGQLMAAVLRPGSGFAIARRDTLFADRFRFASNPHANYDVMPDGRHFIFLEASSTGDMVVAVNWWSQVRARLRAR